MVNFDNIQSPTELTEEQKKAIELHQKMQKTVILSVTAGVLVTLGLGIITILLLMKFGVVSLNKDAVKGRVKTEQTSDLNSGGSSASSAKGGDFDSKFSTIRQIMSGYYFGDVDQKAAADAMYKAYVNAYGDKYSTYYTADEYTQLSQTIQGESFYGIGVMFRADDKGVLVVNFTNGSPAEAAGLKVGDHIVKAGDTELVGLDIDKAVAHLKGEKGTKLHLYVDRDGQQLEFDVERKEIDEKYVNAAVLSDGKTGLIRISSFTNKTAEQFRSELQNLRSKGITRLVIDLRNNTGGVVSSATDILDQVLGTGSFGGMKYKDGKQQTFKGTTEEKLGMPHAVLVNQYSASASEIFAGAIQDFGEGKLVGTKTFGKGITQRVIRLPDGSAIKYTDAQLYTPKGNTWHGVGLTPDIVVELPENATEDTQLNAALEYLNTQN